MSRLCSRSPSNWKLLLCAWLCLGLQLKGEAATGSATNLQQQWSSERQVLRLSIQLAPDAIVSLRKEPRQYVHGVLKETNEESREVAIHLKGSVGSFRPIDNKPSFTLSFSKFQSNRLFHGCSKVHLNNSVEDATYLDEKLGSLVFSGAGIATPAVRHALVELNGRQLGLYVLKEGFTREFLARHFEDATGNLYDTDAGHEITDELNRDVGSGPNDRHDLKQLARAAQISDPKERWMALQRTLDLDEFISFMAIEVMICHRDGYSLARNNYKLYHDPSAGRFVFLPHGMDQLFGRAEFPWRPSMAGLVAQVVMNNPEGHRLYEERFRSFVTNGLNVAELSNEVDSTASLLISTLPKSDLNAFRTAVAELKQKIAQRKEFLLRELSRPERQPLRFQQGVAPLSGWIAVDPPEGGVMNEAIDPDQKPSLHIRAGPLTAASWRCRAVLERGVYRFEGRVRTDRVAPLPYGKNKGARLRVSGGSGSAGLIGSNRWTEVGAKFSVQAESEETELICELRATKGDAWFDRESLRLVKIGSEF